MLQSNQNYEEFLEIMNLESNEEKKDIRIKSKSNKDISNNINNKIQYKNGHDDDEEENIKIMIH